MLIAFAEIKSLAVARQKCGNGIGAKLLAECLRDAKALKVRKVFALTYVPEFFEQLLCDFPPKFATNS